MQCADATYSINPNGTIGVLNRERKGSPTGPVKGANAWANVPNASLPGQLAVHFPGSPFGAPCA